MRVQEGERVISKLFRVINLFVENKSVTTADLVEKLGMNKRTAQRYLSDAIDYMDIRKNDDGSYKTISDWKQNADMNMYKDKAGKIR